MRKFLALFALLFATLVFLSPVAQADGVSDVQPTSPDQPIVYDVGGPNAPPDSNAAFTRLQWSTNGGGFTGCNPKRPYPSGCRWISVKCHFGNYWHILYRGQSSIDACGGTGWIERTWGDSDVMIVVTNDQTQAQHAYLPGNNQIGGGYYHMQLLYVGNGL